MYGIDWSLGAPAQAGAGDGAPAGGAASGATAYQFAGIRELQRAARAHATRDRSSGEMTFDYTAASGVAHAVWYMDARAVLDIFAIARADGLGVGLWRLGEEDQSLWSSRALGARMH